MIMTGDLGLARKALSAACESARDGTEADAVTGIVPRFVASPSSTPEAAALLRAAAEHDLAVVPRGSGSRLGWGSPVTRCDLVVDMLGMGDVIEHAAGDLVARVQAGARVSAVAGVLATAGQEIALDVPPAATIGGVIADALAGPRRLRYGSPRDLLIGITVVRADGTVAHSGGKVVKNVAGYDLGKLLTGSAGTLGLITEATFRLHPLPAARAWVTVTARVKGSAPQATQTLAAVVAAAANSPLVASAVEVHRASPDAPWNIGVLLEGSADGVAARAEQMRKLLGSTMRSGRQAALNTAESWGMIAQMPAPAAAAPDWWGGIPSPDGGTEYAEHTGHAEHTLLRVTFWVSALAAVLDGIDSAARETGVLPVVHGSAGAGVLYVTLPGGAPADAVARLVAAVRAGIPSGRGGVAVVAASGNVRLARGGMGSLTGAVPGLALMRAVKDQFDPQHRMAPGRFPS